ncbi:MAG: hypothetical protein U0L49_09925 [Eubacterium sp.]|nr:hypothetical protein [Eubacterium sp.]
MKLKKLTALTLSVFIISSFGLAACRDKEPSGTSSAASSASNAGSAVTESQVSSESAASESIAAESISSSSEKFSASSSAPSGEPEDIEYISESETYTSASTVETSDTEKALEGTIAGLEDINVLAGNTGVDLTADVYYDPSIIMQAKLDTPDLDLNTPGDYDVTYTMVVIYPALVQYRQQAGLDAPEFTGTDDVQYLAVNKKVHVLSQDDAQKLADSGTPVYADGNNYMKKSDGSEVEKPELKVPSTEVNGQPAVNMSGAVLE